MATSSSSFSFFSLQQLSLAHSVKGSYSVYLTHFILSHLLSTSLTLTLSLFLTTPPIIALSFLIFIHLSFFLLLSRIAILFFNLLSHAHSTQFYFFGLIYQQFLCFIMLLFFNIFCSLSFKSFHSLFCHSFLVSYLLTTLSLTHSLLSLVMLFRLFILSLNISHFWIYVRSFFISFTLLKPVSLLYFLDSSLFHSLEFFPLFTFSLSLLAFILHSISLC